MSLQKQNQTRVVGNIRLTKSGNGLQIGIKTGDTWANYVISVKAVLSVIDKKQDYARVVEFLK